MIEECIRWDGYIEVYLYLWSGYVMRKNCPITRETARARIPSVPWALLGPNRMLSPHRQAASGHAFRRRYYAHRMAPKV